MHELTLTESLFEIFAEEAKRQGFRRVRRVWLEIGELGHVEPEAIAFCFDVVGRGTLAEGAKLDIIRVPGRGWCADCRRETPLAERHSPCAHCGGLRVEMRAGDELRVKELEVE